MKIKLIKAKGQELEIEGDSWERDFLSRNKAVIIYDEAKSPIAYIAQVKEIVEVK